MTSDNDRIEALERRVSALEDLVQAANLTRFIPLGPRMSEPRHGQISWACKFPKEPTHACTWRSCGCACHTAKPVSSESGSKER